MIEVKQYHPPEVIPERELEAWRSSLKKVVVPDCPDEVKQFINAVAEKLPEFGQIGKFNTTITGYELKLCNMSEFNGEPVYDWELYNMPVPLLAPVDHHAAMHRSYRKRGKQGLIDYCKAHCEKSELQKLLDILNVHVFHQEREAFMEVMKEING